MLDLSKEVKDGFLAFPRGILWLKGNIGSAVLLLLPFLLAFVFMIYAMHWVWSDGGRFAESLLYAKPIDQGLLAWLQYGFFWSLIQFGVVMGAVIAAFVFANILSSPINEYVSYRVQLSSGNSRNLVAPFTWNGWFKAFRGEIMKALVIAGISIIVLIIPGLNLLSFICMSFLLGWNFYDYPLARRGFGFRERFRFVISHFISVSIFGFWMCIPIVQLFAFPFAVVGGSLLCMDHLARNDRLSDEQVKKS